MKYKVSEKYNALLRSLCHHFQTSLKRDRNMPDKASDHMTKVSAYETVACVSIIAIVGNKPPLYISNFYVATILVQLKFCPRNYSLSRVLP